MYIINDNALLEGDNMEQSPVKGKDSGPFADGRPDIVVIHYTAGRNLDSAVKTLRNPNVKASAHLVVGQDGKTVQVIPFNRIAWHAGRSRYKDRNGLNKYSIGIEIDNAGRLEKVGNAYKTWFGKEVPDKDVFQGVHRNENSPSYWHAYPEKQIETVFEICRALCEKFSIQAILGHEEISPGRKSDPGPAFPLDTLRSSLLEDRGRDEDTFEDPAPARAPVPEQYIEQKGIVTASSLNIRSDPSKYGDIVREPLLQGQSLDILEDKNGWYRVRVSQLGWVKKDYVKLD